MDRLPDIPLRKLILRISLRLFLILAVLLFIVAFIPSLLDLFAPFILAFLTASLLAPLVAKISKKMGHMRHFLSMIMIILLILSLTGILVYLGYYLITEISGVIGNWSEIRDSMVLAIGELSSLIGSKDHLTSTELENYFIEIAQTVLTWLGEKLSTFAPSLVSGVGNLASGIASFVVSLLFFIVGAYFMTADYPALSQKVTSWIPDLIRPHMRHVKEVMGSAMFGYLRAQMILSGIVALICFLAFLIVGQSYSLLIAIAIGIIDIIPFFGSGVVLIPWAVLKFIWGDYRMTIFLLILSLSLFLFRKLAEPKIVGNQTGLSPVVSLISIYVGMKLGGVLGMILVPILCMIFLGLYRVGFFDPTILDFKLLIRRILNLASLDLDSNKE